MNQPKDFNEFVKFLTGKKLQPYQREMIKLITDKKTKRLVIKKYPPKRDLFIGIDIAAKKDSTAFIRPKFMIIDDPIREVKLTDEYVESIKTFYRDKIPFKIPPSGHFFYEGAVDEIVPNNIDGAK